MICKITRILLYCASVILFLLMANQGYCQMVANQGAPFIKNYSTKIIDVGGPQIMCFVEDKRGMAYFGDGGGILEFNGKEWNRINIPNSSMVRDMDADTLGVIYVGGSNEFGFLQPTRTGEMEYVSLSKTVTDQNIKFYDIWKIICTSQGVYFCANEYVFRYLNKKVTIISVNFLVQDAYWLNNKLYLPTEQGIALLNDTTLVPITNDVTFQLTPWINGQLLTVDGKGILSTTSFENFESKPFDSPVQALLKQEPIQGICRIDKNYFAITTEKNRIVILHNNGQVIQVIDKKSGLMNGVIYQLCVDKYKNLWACMSNGVAKIDIGFPVTKFGENNNIPSSVLATCFFDGTRYIGTQDGIFCLPPFDLGNPEKSRDFVKINADVLECWEFHRYNNQLLALCSSGLWLVSGSKANQIYSIETPQKAHCAATSPLFPNVFFLGMRGKFIALKLKANGAKIPKAEEVFEFPEITEKIRKIICDKDGNLWLNTQYNGIYFLRFINGNIHDYKVSLLGEKNGLTYPEHTKCFRVGDDVVVPSDSGLLTVVFPKEKTMPDSLITFEHTQIFGEPVNEPIGYVAHYSGNKYIIAGNGLVVATVGGNKSSFDTCGFNRLEFVLRGIECDSNSVISFCSPDGLFCYDMKVARDFMEPFNTVISQVVLNDDSTLFYGNFSSTIDSFRIASLIQNKEMIPEIDYQFNSITFHYSALFYEDPDLTVFQHQLAGFDKKWSEWSTDGKTSYTSLSPGKYTFTVQSRNCYGAVGRVAEYCFEILPPWYLAWWAYFVYAFAFIGIIWLVVRLYTRRLKSQKEYLELVVEERTGEIIEQARELKDAYERLKEMDKYKQGVTSMIVHDLKNPINAIMNAGETDPVNQLKRVRQTGKQMLNLVMNILDVSKYEDTKITLTIENHQLLGVCRRAVEQITFLSAEKNITISANIETEACIRADTEIIERVLVNILTNAIKYTPNNGLIKLNAVLCPANKDSDSFLKISVADNGIGIPPDKIHLVFRKFGQVAARNSGSIRSTGLGLAYCKMAVEAHGGAIGVESEPESGSTFWFTLSVAKVNLESINNIETVTVKNQHAMLSDSIKAKIEAQLTELRNTKFYKITEITDILSRIKDDRSGEFDAWKHEVINAAESGNETLYMNLLQ